MGINTSITYAGPSLQGYFDATRQGEASEELDEAIINHLKDIGAGTAIPIRKEIAGELNMPIALNSPAIEKVNDSEFKVNFASSCKGIGCLSYGDEVQEFKFKKGQNLHQILSKPPDGICKLTFKFEEARITSRTFTFNITTGCIPVMTNDEFMMDGFNMSIYRVFNYETENDDSGMDTSDICLICCDPDPNVVCMPCRHCCMCRSCAEKFASMSNNCPVCRSPVNELVEFVERPE